MGENKQAVRCLRMINKNPISAQRRSMLKILIFDIKKNDCLNVHLGIGSNENAELFLICLCQINNFAQKRSVDETLSFLRQLFSRFRVILEPKVKSQF